MGWERITYMLTIWKNIFSGWHVAYMRLQVMWLGCAARLRPRPLPGGYGWKSNVVKPLINIPPWLLDDVKRPPAMVDSIYIYIYGLWHLHGIYHITTQLGFYEATITWQIMHVDFAPLFEKATSKHLGFMVPPCIQDLGTWQCGRHLGIIGYSHSFIWNIHEYPHLSIWDYMAYILYMEYYVMYTTY